MYKTFCYQYLYLLQENIFCRKISFAISFVNIFCRKSTSLQNKHLNSNGLGSKPPTGITNKNHGSDSEIKTNQTISKASDRKSSTENFLETERNSTQTSADLNQKVNENSTGKTRHAKSAGKINSAIPNKTKEEQNITRTVSDNNQKKNINDKDSEMNTNSSTVTVDKVERKNGQPCQKKPKSAMANNHTEQIQNSQNNNVENKQITKDQNKGVRETTIDQKDLKTEQTETNETELKKNETAKSSNKETLTHNKQAQHIVHELAQNTDGSQMKGSNNKIPETTKDTNAITETIAKGEENDLIKSKNETANDINGNKEVPKVVKVSTESVNAVPDFEETIAKESYDREHEAELAEIEILNTPPKPGKYYLSGLHSSKFLSTNYEEKKIERVLAKLSK